MTAAPVVVIGTGLVGASIGCALSSAGVPVHLRDHKLSHARVAASLGAGTLDPPVAADVDLVVAAVPPTALVDVVAHALDSYPNATVTDVGSVKSGVLNALWDHHLDLARYVGSHPMAGSQHSGPVTARPDLFEDRTWVITPHRRSGAHSIARVSALVKACGAREVRMDVEDHDAAVARVSHLPHLMSALMAGHLTTVPGEHLQLAGQGLRDVTRVAGSDPFLWDQIVAANATAVLPELRSIHDQLSRVIAAIEQSADREELHRQLQRGVDGTRRIPGKHGAAPVTYSQVVIEIPDAPGALGRLFAEVGEAGINVEDISIEHDQARQVGYLSLAVTPEQAGDLTATMHERGWDVVSGGDEHYAP